MWGGYPREIRGGWPAASTDAVAAGEPLRYDARAFSLRSAKGGGTMPTPEKAAANEELTEKMQRAQLAVVTDYRGLTVRDLATLRRQLRPFEVDYTIAKNTLLRIAARNRGIEGSETLLRGPTAIAFCYQDIVGPSKA